ncbi:tagaturonate reductase [Paenibacillus massiliensis]|uniref:tagaturonate reductase n=1 Tax=Paenibacillus massiliensis TaxID=225917 RepID=UPI00046EA177|nr:tagaturonate reductase [Paenibacillus massiliensis]
MERLVRSSEASSDLVERVIQFGDGNFMRGFAEWHIDVMNERLGWNTGVVVLQARAEGTSAEGLNEQGGVYTLQLEGIQHGEEVREQRVIECITRGMNPHRQYEAFMQLADSPDIRFVLSNTTESGIVYDPDDRLEDQPQRSFPGKLAALLYRRYQTFQADPSKGWIIVPCELIERNGEILRDIIVQHAHRWELEEGFLHWLKEANTFCNSLVDRIVPGYPKDRAAELQQQLGYQDPFMIVGEPYHLWVIEGPEYVRAEFPADLAKLNLLVVDDLKPYREQKVRILNGAHTALTPVAYLSDLETVREAVEDPEVGAYIRNLIHREIIPTLDLSEQALKSFAEDVIDRFRNPFIKHYVMSIALNSFSKFRTRNLPVLLEYHAKHNELPSATVFALAALLVMYKGRRGAEKIELSDNPVILQELQDMWRDCTCTREELGILARAVLQHEDWWGQDLTGIAGLVDQLADQMFIMETHGMKEALRQQIYAVSGSQPYGGEQHA